jgi:hypothetical protein
MRSNSPILRYLKESEKKIKAAPQLDFMEKCNGEEGTLSDGLFSNVVLLVYKSWDGVSILPKIKNAYLHSIRPSRGLFDSITTLFETELRLRQPFRIKGCFSNEQLNLHDEILFELTDIKPAHQKIYASESIEGKTIYLVGHFPFDMRTLKEQFPAVNQAPPSYSSMSASAAAGPSAPSSAASDISRSHSDSCDWLEEDGAPAMPASASLSAPVMLPPSANMSFPAPPESGSPAAGVVQSFASVSAASALSVSSPHASAAGVGAQHSASASVGSPISIPPPAANAQIDWSVSSSPLVPPWSRPQPVALMGKELIDFWPKRKDSNDLLALPSCSGISSFKEGEVFDSVGNDQL